MKMRRKFNYNKYLTIAENMRSFHHRMMMRYLRKRGWVVFYLDERNRECKSMCWLQLYQDKLIRKDNPDG